MTRRPVRSMRTFASRQLRDLPPGRRLRLRQAILDAVEGRFGGEPSLRLLDAGSEEGLLCLELARRHPGWRLVAADIAEGPLQRGRGWAGTERLQVSYLTWDLQRQLGEPAFDVVAALESLVEIPNDQLRWPPWQRR